MIDGSDAAAAGSKPSGQQLGFLLFLYSSFPFFSHPSFPSLSLSSLLSSLSLFSRSTHFYFHVSEPAPRLRSLTQGGRG